MPIKHLLDQNWSMPRLIWDPHNRTQINQIEKVQRRAARYVTNRYHNTSSVTDMLQNLNWPSLEITRTRVRLMLYKIIHHIVAIHPLDTLLLPTTTITRYNLVVIHINIIISGQTKTRIHFILEL